MTVQVIKLTPWEIRHRNPPDAKCHEKIKFLVLVKAKGIIMFLK
jgi:hypothetical protein